MIRSTSHKTVGATAILASLLIFSHELCADTASNTYVEVLYGTQYERPYDDGAIFSIVNSSQFSWGDSYFFADVSDFVNTDLTDGIHMEFGPRYSLLRKFGNGVRESGTLRDFYLIAQLDFDSNAFVQKTTKMAGLSADWNIPGFVFFSSSAMFRDDPTLDGNSVQIVLAWLKTFGDGNFSFEGFVDWTSSEGNGMSNLLTQPQLLWRPNEK